MITLCHKRRTAHSIFQIRISINTKCAERTGFPRPGHIYHLILFKCSIHTMLVLRALKAKLTILLQSFQKILNSLSYVVTCIAFIEFESIIENASTSVIFVNVAN